MKVFLPIVFIASASEGLNVVAPAQTLLTKALDRVAEVRLWPRTFGLTRAYIESLERNLDLSDFAVVVLTPDDKTESRGSGQLSPRDNVIFELGLFFGRLGRNRCFLIVQQDVDLKLPTDLRGLENAAFSIPPGQDVDETALASACARIAEAICQAINELPSKPRISDQERAIKEAMRRFGDRIRGTWWERIQARGEAAPAISFLTIDVDEVHSSVALNGKAYDSDGIHVATWRSAAASLEGNRVVYIRQCQRLDAKAKTTAWLPGLAEVNFNDSSHAIVQGDGKFWESDESRPKDTVIKFVELRRSQDDNDSVKMQKGSVSERQALVQELLKNW
jgi:hypothetical protein